MAASLRNRESPEERLFDRCGRRGLNCTTGASYAIALCTRVQVETETSDASESGFPDARFEFASHPAVSPARRASATWVASRCVGSPAIFGRIEGLRGDSAAVDTACEVEKERERERETNLAAGCSGDQRDRICVFVYASPLSAWYPRDFVVRGIHGTVYRPSLGHGGLQHLLRGLNFRRRVRLIARRVTLLHRCIELSD